LCAVYNWTVDNVISWLSDHVELAQYAPAFTANSIEGRALPRYVLMVFLICSYDLPCGECLEFQYCCTLFVSVRYMVH